VTNASTMPPKISILNDLALNAPVNAKTNVPAYVINSSKLISKELIAIKVQFNSIVLLKHNPAGGGIKFSLAKEVYGRNK
jgi:hypothetical protein